MDLSDLPVAAQLETAISPPVPLVGGDDTGSSSGGGGGSWIARLLRPRVTVTAPVLGTKAWAPYGAPGAWWKGALVVACVLAGIVVLAGVGFWHIVTSGRRRKGG